MTNPTTDTEAEISAFIKAAVAAGYPEPIPSKHHHKLFAWARDEDRYIGWRLARAPAAPAAVAGPSKREQFEAWAASHFASANLEREGEGYRFSLAKEWWSAWCAVLAATPAEVQAEPVADCYSDDDGDTWRDLPSDIDFVHGRKLGEEFELQASVRSWSETFRVTKVPDETSDEYEVEPVSVRTAPRAQPADAVAEKAAKYDRLLPYLCKTCGGFGLVGSHSQDGSFDSQSCPDCSQPADALDAAFEAVRKRLCKIPRYSFHNDSRGNLRRVNESSGNWIEFASAHALFDPAAVDAAMAAAQGGGNAANGKDGSV